MQDIRSESTQPFCLLQFFILFLYDFDYTLRKCDPIVCLTVVGSSGIWWRLYRLQLTEHLLSYPSLQ